MEVDNCSALATQAAVDAVAISLREAGGVGTDAKVTVVLACKRRLHEPDTGGRPARRLSQGVTGIYTIELPVGSTLKASDVVSALRGSEASLQLKINRNLAKVGVKAAVTVLSATSSEVHATISSASSLPLRGEQLAVVLVLATGIFAWEVR